MTSFSEKNPKQRVDKDISMTSFIVDGVLIDIYGIPHGCGSRIENKNLIEIKKIVSLDTPVYFDSDIGLRYGKAGNVAYDWLSMSPLDAVKYGFISVVHPTLLLSRCKELFHWIFNRKERSCDSLAISNAEECVKKLIELQPKLASNYNSMPNWLRVMSKYVNYPLVSIYLMEYVVYHARMNGSRHVSILCSESISDIVQWYASIYDESEHWICLHSEECKNAVHNTIENKYYFRYRKHVYKIFSRSGKLMAYLLYLLPLIYMLA